MNGIHLNRFDPASMEILISRRVSAPATGAKTAGSLLGRIVRQFRSAAYFLSTVSGTTSSARSCVDLSMTLGAIPC